MPPEHQAPTSVIDALEADVITSPAATRFTFLANGQDPLEVLTVEDLYRRAFRIGAALDARAASGERVLLVVPDRLEFIVALVGCLMAGAVAVPAVPPVGQGAVGRLRRIVRTARPKNIVTLGSLRPRLQSLLEDESDETTPALCTLEELEAAPAAGWRRPDLRAESIALLQYSSGSTGAPKGVVVTHGNLMANCRVLHDASWTGPDSRLVSWLPFHHDWGLIGCVVYPIVERMPCILLEPRRFLTRPLRWLRAISRFRATISCAPNFAYEMCADALGKDDPEDLDLSCWEVAMIGAEPVRSESLERFATSCAPFGFHRESFFPTYGLAEHTLIASGGPPGRGAHRLELRRDALERGRVVPTSDPTVASRTLVGCGRPVGSHSVAIVDPVSALRCEPDAVGEIWLSGESVAAGYWEDAESTREVFGAELDGKTWLRTGDLGFLKDGELFIGGRLKGIIIKHGRNFFAEDVERAAGTADPALRPGAGVAFSLEAAGAERLVVIQELRVGPRPDVRLLIGSIRRAVSAEVGVRADAVLIMPPGKLEKTTSGKIRRRHARNRFTGGDLDALGQWCGWE